MLIVLAVELVSKSYGDQLVLDQVSLSVAQGEILALLGPNGAGKTTLLSIVAGLRSADAGRVKIGGHDVVTSRSEAVSLIGIAPQDTGVQLLLSARENLEFYARLAGVTKADLARSLERVIVALSIDDFIDKPCSQLSGGQRRRVHTACAIVGRPQLLLLDEPTVGADIEMRSQLLELVASVAAEGTAVLYTTHYLPEVEALNARVAMLEHGRVLVDMELGSLLAEYATSAIDLKFDGPVPDVSIEGLEVTRSGSNLVLQGPGASGRMAEVLGALGQNVQHLDGIELLRPNLETAYLALAGQRFAAGEVAS